MEKQFNVMTNIGSSPYVVNFHDGQATHKDGSPFFGAVIFHSKRKMAAFIRTLRNSGYIEK